MKIGIATGLSVAGVIAAGAAAFALNSAVLSGESAKITSDQVATTLAGVQPAGDASVTAAGDQVTTNSTQVSDTVTTYAVGTAGSVVVDSATGAVNVTDVVPGSGWTAEPARVEPDGSVKVHFVNGSSRIEFVARMSNGKVTVTVNNESTNAPGTAVNGTQTRPSVPPSFRGDDDDDNEEHHDGDFEDHQERDDHEDDD